MTQESKLSLDGDPFRLQRFVASQAATYADALSELHAGRKHNHWMWYIFPQLHGLGHRAMAIRDAIQSRDEALAYLRHLVLGRRRGECIQALLALLSGTARDIFGRPDDLKRHSSLPLFAAIALPGSVFYQALDRFFDGQPDERTLRLLDQLSASSA